MINTVTPINTFGVGRAGREVYILKPLPQHLSNQDALNLAAWLVTEATGDPESDFFPMFNEMHLSRLGGRGGNRG